MILGVVNHKCVRVQTVKKASSMKMLLKESYADRLSGGRRNSFVKCAGDVMLADTQMVELIT